MPASDFSPYPAHEAGTHRLFGVDVRRLARASVPGASCAKRRWLEVYAHTSTRSRSTRPSTGWPGARRWRAGFRRLRPEFLFAVKASRYLTHVKRLVDIGEGINRFYEPLEPLVQSGRLGPVLWQLPENFHRDDARLAGWLELLPAR